MGQNILTYENISPYRVSGRGLDYAGMWVQRNGVWAMRVNPYTFYDGTTSSYQKILLNEFKPNTRYLFNIWIDTDDHYHNDTYTSAGIYIRYTDNTRDGTIYCGSSSTARGWQYKHYLTPAGKSVQNIEIGYNYGDASYIRWDSYIVPYDTQKVAHTGQGIVSHLAEGASPCVFTNGGGINTNEVIEF